LDMKKDPFLVVLLISSTWTQPTPGEAIERIPDEKTGLAGGVAVTDSALAHTAQFMALDSKGEVIGKGDPLAQALNVLERLETTIEACESNIDRLVKLNVYVDSPETAEKVRDLFRRKFAGANPPAVAFVETPLPHPDAQVAMDAVVATDLASGGDPLKLKRPDSDYGVPEIAHAGLLPKGPAVYVSGQAEQGPLSIATRKTLESLERTLEFLGLDLTRVVQIKSFLSPMAQSDVVRQEIDAFFGEVRTPPLVFVEWKSTLPIEIEVIAAGHTDPSSGNRTLPIEYLNPPEIEASPIFSRVVRVNSPSRIYVSGLYGGGEEEPGREVERIFESMSDLLARLGGDLRHLAKATYYVSTSEASSKLNELRPKYYDPERPPAASKAMVHGVGMEGRSSSLDMIAVPVPKKP
jgi:enamine deaminase RidA (YjgF/YER057c/UK114 family)